MQTPFPIPDKTNSSGLILAGGQGKRLNGEDKGLILLANRPLIEYSIEALAPQVSQLMISANRNRLAYEGYGLPVVADADQAFRGPLAGILSGLMACQTEWLQCIPCDNPVIPAELFSKLASAITPDVSVAIPRWHDGLQPVYCLLHRSLQSSLASYLKAGQHKVQGWLLQQPHVIVEFDDSASFFNINTATELEQAKQP